MTRWKIRRTVWGWSLYHEGELVCSADCPFPLVLYPAFLQSQDPNWRGAHRQ